MRHHADVDFGAVDSPRRCPARESLADLMADSGVSSSKSEGQVRSSFGIENDARYNDLTCEDSFASCNELPSVFPELVAVKSKRHQSICVRLASNQCMTLIPISQRLKFPNSQGDP